ncbi:MAG: hypothetical protein J7L55_03095, partial [Desulfurococcales archaeon]|nr:hypothetical protein [Desulfurococcales archaeon]
MGQLRRSTLVALLLALLFITQLLTLPTGAVDVLGRLTRDLPHAPRSWPGWRCWSQTSEFM